MQLNKPLIPVVKEYFKPILLVLNENGKEMSNKDIEKKVIKLMHLSEDIVNIPHKSGNISEISYRLSWAKTYLKNHGLIKNTSRGKWIINQKNLSIETINFKTLVYYKAFDLKDIFVIANDKFLKKESALLKSDVSERCICASLKGYIEKEILKSNKYKNYHVDVEYNRNAGHIKSIINEEMKVIHITCDLIIHSRGENEQQDNLLALEMKKSYQSENEKNSDKERLMILTKPTSTNDTWSYDGKTFPQYVCGYLLGVYYEIDLPNNRIIIEYYRLVKCVERKCICLV